MHLTESMEVGTKQQKLTGRFAQTFWKLPYIYSAVSFPNFPKTMLSIIGASCRFEIHFT